MGDGEIVVVEKNSVDWQINGCRRRHPSMKGLTLIELLVVVGILSVLTAVGLPVLGSIRRQTRNMRDIVYTRQTAAAEIMYANDNDGRFAEPLSTIWSRGWGWT